MLPWARPGDLLLLAPAAQRRLKPGHVVVASRPLKVRGSTDVSTPDRYDVVKRLVAVGGDKTPEGVPGPAFVPRGTIVLLGDNALESVDSRHFGPVSRLDVRFIVLGRIRIPRSPGTGGGRAWHRRPRRF